MSKGIDPSPKVTNIVSSTPLPASDSFTMLVHFLQRQQQEHSSTDTMHSHWEDLYRVAETLASQNAEHETLRTLRLSAPLPILSPSPVRLTGAVTAPIKNEEEYENKNSQLAVEGSSDDIDEDAEEQKSADVKAEESGGDEHNPCTTDGQKRAKKAAKKVKKGKKSKKRKRERE
jgi:hypothetical protein